ncbi:MAG: hypothetical protein ACOYD0_10410 [Candidatus Nanopelagicales bacterium]
MSSSNTGAPASDLPGEPDVTGTGTDGTGTDGTGAHGEAVESAADPVETLTLGQRASRAWCMLVKAAGATFGIY